MVKELNTKLEIPALQSQANAHIEKHRRGETQIKDFFLEMLKMCTDPKLRVSQLVH
jgi:hypothetical protein